MCGKGVSVLAWWAQSRGCVADKTAHPLHYPLRNFSPPHVVQQPCWYDPVKGPSHVERQFCSHTDFVLPCCVNLLNYEVQGGFY